MSGARFFCAVAGLIALCGAVSAAPAGRPGGLFDERLRAAKTRRPQSRVQPAPRRQQTPPAGEAPAVVIRRYPSVARPAAAPRRAASPAPTRRASLPAPSPRRTARVSRPSPVTARTLGTRSEHRVAAPPAPPAPRRAARPAPVPPPAEIVPAPPKPVVTYSIDPRGERSSTPPITGDLVLFAEPRDVEVHFTWEGGEFRGRETTVIKDFFLPQTVEITAHVPELGIRHVARIPVRGNCITTARFSFPDLRREARAGTR